jgi:dephospho-CoA kinase
LDGYLDKIIVVTAPYELRIIRASRRDAVSAENIKVRINSQMSQKDMFQHADYEVVNDDCHSLVEQVDYIVGCLKRDFE